jgi:hypothetical protein
MTAIDPTVPPPTPTPASEASLRASPPARDERLVHRRRLRARARLAAAVRRRTRARPAADPHESPPTFRARLESVARLRDSVFAVAGFVYVLGYASWAFYAWDRGLGLLPPLEGQYFVSGIAPALLVLLGVAGHRVIARLAARRRARPSAADLRLATRLERVGTVLVAAGLLGEWIDSRRGGSWLGSLATGAMLIGLVAVCARAFVSASRSDRVFARAQVWYARVALPLFAAAAFVLYVQRIFPGVPAELGGPAARCVVLDVERERVSSAMLADPLGASVSGDEKVVRSAPVWLLFEGGDAALLARSTPIEPGRVQRLAEGAIDGVSSASGCRRGAEETSGAGRE